MVSDMTRVHQPSLSDERQWDHHALPDLKKQGSQTIGITLTVPGTAPGGTRRQAACIKLRTIWVSNPTSPYEGQTALDEPPPPTGSPHRLAMPALRVSKEESGRTYTFGNEPTEPTYQSTVSVC
ncbi:hypothetical protein BHE74_00038619 [Ensete ventricosum]|nr:hypothetical protein BHE74_00038619 [Ensete ventricosum]